ncbi:hypothetical protein [Caballeronia catudaia]|uniref:hypothetical protein n=1 Tax=Caballeronia catudaia TaxID=1777136 RepID=UPI001180B135|nr:hypothetical protein [Caballeronia catudaia]
MRSAALSEQNARYYNSGGGKGERQPLIEFSDRLHVQGANHCEMEIVLFINRLTHDRINLRNPHFTMRIDV